MSTLPLVTLGASKEALTSSSDRHHCDSLLAAGHKPGGGLKYFFEEAHVVLGGLGHCGVTPLPHQVLTQVSTCHASANSNLCQM